MFITKKHISRRTVLQGQRRDAGTAASGSDDSGRDGAGANGGHAEAPICRLLCAARHGARLLGPRAPRARWTPRFPSIGNRWSRSAISTVILSGLHSRSAEPPPGATGADHWVAAAFLCADKPKKTAGADVRAGTTIDQMIAEKIGRDNLMPSMQLAVEDPGANSSNCGEGYSCTYTNTISWSSPTQPLPMELNPQVVFERMFGDGSTAEQRDRAAQAGPEHSGFAHRQPLASAQRSRR